MRVQRSAPRHAVLGSKQAHCNAHHSHCRHYSPVARVTTSQGSRAVTTSPEKPRNKAAATSPTTRHQHSQSPLQRKPTWLSLSHGRPGSAGLITKSALRRLLGQLNNDEVVHVGDGSATTASTDASHPDHTPGDLYHISLDEDGNHGSVTAASDGPDSPDYIPGNVRNDEAHHDSVIEVSLQLAGDSGTVPVVMAPACLPSQQQEPMCTGLQDAEPVGCSAKSLKSPNKRPLSPEFMSCKQSASPKRRQLPAAYSKLAVAGPPSPLQLQEMPQFRAWGTAWDPCSISCPANGCTFKASPGAANMVLGVMAPAQPLALNPRYGAAAKQGCSASSSAAEHVVITILDSNAASNASPTGHDVVKLVLLLDGEAVRAIITPPPQLCQPLCQQALPPGDLSDTHSGSQLIPQPVVLSASNKPPLSCYSSSSSPSLSTALAFNASVKMVGSMAYVLLGLLDNLSVPASYVASSSAGASTAIGYADAGSATLQPPLSFDGGNASAIQLDNLGFVAGSVSSSSSTYTPTAVSDQAVLGSPRSLPYASAFSYEKGCRTMCTGDGPVGCNSSSTDTCAQAPCTSVEMVDSTGDLHLELQGEQETMCTTCQRLRSSPLVAEKPTALQIPASPTMSLFVASCGSSSSDLSNAPVTDAMHESAFVAPVTLPRKAAGKPNAPSSWLARAVHGVVSSLFAPCLGMQPTAADGDHEGCRAVTANNRRRSMHGMRRTSAGRGDGDVWVSIRTAGNKAGSGVSKSVRKLSSVRSRKDVALVVDDQ